MLHKAKPDLSVWGNLDKGRGMPQDTCETSSFEYTGVTIIPWLGAIHVSLHSSLSSKTVTVFFQALIHENNAFTFTLDHQEALRYFDRN